MKVYRIDNEKEQRGIWRTFEGEWKPIFDELTDGKCRDLPMPHNDLYHEGGYWFAATTEPELLQHWMSKQDLIDLQKLGFEICEYQVTSYKVLGKYECIFLRENILSKKVCSVEEIYPD